ncbi:DUF2155 domain-containing protein [Aquicoccus sp. SU-CL01552]|uniref:DUF2155 domain-containing protein n=1 Tax=Aquicoccus sp. SU-CL01552 TaxID=3127656 RepID=UPI00333E77FC
MAAPFAVPLAAQETAVESGTGAVLRGLDKVNGESRDIEIGRGETGTVFGLDIALSDCRYPAENPTGDAFAYLTIWERGAAQAAFEGWMIASSPALNALDHSRYDIWVLRCITP